MTPNTQRRLLSNETKDLGVTASGFNDSLELVSISVNEWTTCKSWCRVAWRTGSQALISQKKKNHYRVFDETEVELKKCPTCQQHFQVDQGVLQDHVRVDVELMTQHYSDPKCQSK